MYDWIIEADVYRLRKAAWDSTSADERRRLETLAEEKLAMAHRRSAEPARDKF